MNSPARYPLRLLTLLDGQFSQSTEIQRSILESQAVALQAISDLTGISTPAQSRQEVFSRQQLEEFACGSIAKCFGSEYAVLDQRPAPRIPNGRLLLIDRVIEITGIRKKIAPPASIASEVDVPMDAWYLHDNPYHGLPVSILMEMALQPCGILSAYQGTSLVIPPENHLFRNLDGWITLRAQPELRGKTISNRAELIKSVASGGLYIQTYRFELSVDGSVFLEGESSFGYFTPSVMNNQSGLDLGEKRKPLIEMPNFQKEFAHMEENLRSSSSLLDLSDKVWINQEGGRHELGAVAGQHAVNAADWYFANHFYGDPVMPGSLGVETITRGLASLARQKAEKGRSPMLNLHLPSSHPLRWKYRGQVVPRNHTTHFETHVKDISNGTSGKRITADADFWVDGLRIYSIDNLSFVMKEGK